MHNTIIWNNNEIKEGDTVSLAYEFRDKIRIGKFKVYEIHLENQCEPSGIPSNIRLAPVYNWDLTNIEIRDNLRYLDLNPSQFENALRTDEEWLEFVKSPAFIEK